SALCFAASIFTASIGFSLAALAHCCCAFSSALGFGFGFGGVQFLLKLANRLSRTSSAVILPISMSLGLWIIILMPPLGSKRSPHLPSTFFTQSHLRPRKRTPKSVLTLKVLCRSPEGEVGGARSSWLPAAAHFFSSVSFSLAFRLQLPLCSFSVGWVHLVD